MKRARIAVTVTVTYDPNRAGADEVSEALEHLVATSNASVLVEDMGVKLERIESGAEVYYFTEDEP